MTLHTECTWLEDYLCHELGSNESDQFVSHLKTCDDCRNAVHNTERIEGILKTKNDAIAVPWSLTNRVLQELNPRQPVTRIRPARNSFKFRMAVAASVAGVSLIGWWLIKTTTTRPHETSIVSRMHEKSQTEQSLVSMEAPAIRVSSDYLVTSMPQDDESFEFYWVLPKLNQ
jgi:hypothetical protein